MRAPMTMNLLELKNGRIELSDVLVQHVIEVNTCKQTETQLTSLQEWVKKQSEVSQSD
jgi:hypothetical protein